MKVYKGVSASPGLVLGQVSRLEHHVETFSHGPFNPERELRLLANAVHTAQNELDSMAERAAPTEQAIFLFQSMMLDDEGMMNEVRFCINAGISASAAMHQVGQRYADQLANMKDNPYMQLRSVDILDATRRVINILTNRPRVWLALDHPVILAADRLMPTDLFSVPSGMILGVITAEGSGQSHAAIIARAMNIPGIVQVGKDFLDDCDGRTVILDATNGNCILDPDAVARQQAEASICQLQREDAEMKQLHSLPDETRDGEPFELLANCFGPEDIDTAMQSGAKGVGLLRSGYMMLPGRILDEQEQYFFYCSCLAAANGCPVTVRTFDFGSDRTVADANQGPQSSKLGLRGIRNSLRQPQQFQTQICALLRAAARGPLRVMFPMVTDVEDWDAAMSIVEHCRQSLRERGVPFNENTQFGVMLSIPAACLTVEDFVAHGCDFLVIGTNDLTQYTHAADRELASAERYYRPASPAMKKLIAMVMEAAKAGSVPVSFCYQSEPRGLGHAVRCASFATNGEPFFVLLGDYVVPDKKILPRMKEVSDAHNGASVIAVAACPADEVSRYGIIAGEPVGAVADFPGATGDEEGAVWRMTGMVEKPAAEDAPSRLFAVGRYLLSPRVMELLSDQQPGAGNEIQLTDAMVRAMAEEEFYALVIDVHEGYDTGTPAGWIATNARLAAADPRFAAASQEAMEG